MLCSEFDARMQSLLDERKPPEVDPALLSHAQRCASCHAQLATLSRCSTRWTCWRFPTCRQISPNGSSTRFTNPHQTAPMLAPSTWMLVAVAIAATLLLAALPITWYAMSDHVKWLNRPTRRRSSTGRPSSLRSPNSHSTTATRLVGLPLAPGSLSRRDSPATPAAGQSDRRRSAPHRHTVQRHDDRDSTLIPVGRSEPRANPAHRSVAPRRATSEAEASELFLPGHTPNWLQDCRLNQSQPHDSRGARLTSICDPNLSRPAST